MEEKAKKPEYVNTVEVSWGPSEVIGSAWLFRKYLQLLEQSGILLDQEKVKEWFRSVRVDTDIVRIVARDFERIIRQAKRDDARLKAFEKSPPELTDRMKGFLAYVRQVLGLPQMIANTELNTIADLHLDGSTISERVKNLVEKHEAALTAAATESLACLLLGKVLGYEWEINVNNAEIRQVIAQARYELKQMRLRDDILKKFDELLIHTGVSKAALLQEFGIRL